MSEYKWLSGKIYFSMLTVRLHNVELSVTFGFLLLIAINSLSVDNVALGCLLFSAAHELAHLAAMWLNGIEVDAIRLYGGGIKISSSDISVLSISAQAAIYSAGCAANFLMGVLFLILGVKDIAAVNFCLGAFNLLPVEYFDGGKLLRLFVSEKGVLLRLVLAAFTVFLIIAAVVGAVASVGKIPLSLTIVSSLIIFSELLDN